MTGFERIRAAVNFRKTDRVPVIPQVFGHAAAVSGMPLDQYLRDGEKLAYCQLRALERYGYDAVFALMDVNVETEAMGSTLRYRANQYPVVESYVLHKGAEIGSLQVPDPRRTGRMPEILNAVHLLRRSLGDDVAVVGCVLGPLTLATQLMGAETALLLAIDDPAQFALLLDLAMEVVGCFGTAQIEAGAHLLMVFDPSASPDMVPHQFFREFELPRLRRMFDLFRRAGSMANWLHIAGPVDRILPLYGKMDVNIANFDYCVAPSVAQNALPGVCLNGNLKPLDFVDGTPDQIAASSGELMDVFASRKGFILSSGCEIPPEAKPENVAAMVASAVTGN